MSAFAFTESFAVTRDGERLYTRTVFPLSYTEGMKMPAVFQRTPYEAAVEQKPFDPGKISGKVLDFLNHGYIFVMQHCRGTGSSTGEFLTYRHEREDGLDTLAWIREQKWFNHEIYLYGGSYCSYVHTSYIALNPPDVKGAVLCVMPHEVRRSYYEKNTFKHDQHTMWFSKVYRSREFDKAAVYEKMRQEIRNRPFTELAARVYGSDVPELTERFTHCDPDDPFWRDPDTCCGQALRAPLDTEIPILFVGGLYDIHFRGTADYFRAVPSPVHEKCAMLVGPWTHGLKTLPEHAELFPDSAHPPVETEWFDHIRLGTPLRHVTEGRITYYVPGKGWVTGKDFGDMSSRELVLYPSEGGKLAREASSGSLTYTYDPRDPLGLPGGCNCFQSPLRGPQPQPEPGFRQDLLSFVSDPFGERVCIDGRADVKLEISSDCPDTAFFVRVDVVRGGVALCLRDTVVSVSELVKDYLPGSRVTLNFFLDEIVWCLQEGDRIRIDVSSSDFPTYNAHSNTAEPWYEAVETRVARNTVYTEGSSFTFRVTPE